MPARLLHSHNQLAAWLSVRCETSLGWRHNECDGVSHHQPHDCLLNHLLKCRSKKTSKLCITGLCEKNSPGTGDFPTQRVSNAVNVSIWSCRHVVFSWLVLLFVWLANRAEMICPTHDEMQYMMWCTWYATFCGTFAVLSWEAETCGPGLWSGALHATYYYCLHSNDARWLQQCRPPSSFQVQFVCAEFAHFIGIYWLLLVVSCIRFYLGMLKLYHIISLFFQHLSRYPGLYTYCSLCICGIPVCQCIVSALLANRNIDWGLQKYHEFWVICSALWAQGISRNSCCFPRQFIGQL